MKWISYDDFENHCFEAFRYRNLPLKFNNLIRSAYSEFRKLGYTDKDILDVIEVLASTLYDEYKARYDGNQRIKWWIKDRFAWRFHTWAFPPPPEKEEPFLVLACDMVAENEDGLDVDVFENLEHPIQYRPDRPYFLTELLGVLSTVYTSEELLYALGELTIREAANKSGLASTTFYNRFKSKKDRAAIALTFAGYGNLIPK